MVEIIIALRWPLFTFFYLLFFALIFRKQLSALISRITSIDKTGIRASQNPEAQREKQKTEAVQELLIAIGDSIVLRDLEGNIRSDLQKRGLETEGDTIKVLVKLLAATKILFEFEQIYNFIFGSQIFLLKKLNEVAGQGQKKEYVAEHVENIKKLFKSELGGWSFDHYMAFLIARSLVTIDGETYHITNLGVEYLIWMARTGRSENRPL